MPFSRFTNVPFLSVSGLFSRATLSLCGMWPQQEQRCPPAPCFPVCSNKAFVHKRTRPACPSRVGPPVRGAALALRGPRAPGLRAGPGREGHAGRGRGGGGRGEPGGGGGRRGEAGAGRGRGGGRRPAASVASPQLCWPGVCVECSDVDSVHKSLTSLLLLGCCLCDNNSLQLHLFSYPGKIALRGDMDASVVGRPRHDSVRAPAAAHGCTAAGAGPSREGGMIAAGGVTVPCRPLSLAPDNIPSPHRPLSTSATELLTAHLLTCKITLVTSFLVVVWWQ